MLSFHWFSSLKNHLRPSRNFRARRNQHHRNQISFTQPSVSRNVIEALEDRTLLTAFTVVNTNDSGTGSLREAIELANANAGADTISFDAALAGQTIILTDELLISDDLTIEGLGADQLTLDGNGDSRIFKIDDGSTSITINVEISGLTLTNGYADFGGAISNTESLFIADSTLSLNEARLSGAGIHTTEGLLSLTRSTITENKAVGGAGIYSKDSILTVNMSTFSKNISMADGGGARGGGIYYSNSVSTTGSPSTITDSKFSENKSYTGGGIYSSGSLSVSNSEFSSNEATQGGGIYLSTGNDRRISKIIDSTFLDNTAIRKGGGIYNGGSRLNVESSTFADNKATDGPSQGWAQPSGGGIYSDGGSLIVIDSVFSRNTADLYGGAIQHNKSIFENNNRAAFLAVSNSTFHQNSAKYGGGIQNSFTPTFVFVSTFTENNAKYGGGIDSNSGALTVEDSLFSNNEAIADGGGIRSSGTLSVRGSTFDQNTSGTSGGAISNKFTGTATISNSTLSRNIAAQTGGGLFSASELPLTVINSTIILNSATIKGGGISSHPTSNIIINSIVAGNTANEKDQTDIPATTKKNELYLNNLIQNNIFQDSIEGLLDPVLKDNGGPTPTHALVAGSAAINAGYDGIVLSKEQTNDQRGVGYFRIMDGTVDIGAYEFYDYVLVVDTLSDEDDGDYSIGQLSLREAIKIANTTPEADTITFATNLTGQTIILNSELLISDNMTITGLGEDQLIISGNHSSRIFNVDDGDTETTINVEMSGLTLTNGLADNGGAILNHENLSVFNSTISKNEATLNGGGIYHAAGLLTINETTFAENLANESGGGIYNSTQDLVVSKSIFYRNVAELNGGGIYTLQGVSKYALRKQTEPLVGYQVSTTSELQLVPVISLFPEYDLEYNSITITDSHFIENSANRGGGLYSAYKNGPSIYNFWNCDVLSSPGATVASHNVNTDHSKSEFFLTNSTFVKNTAINGGGIFNSAGLIEMERNSIRSNLATYSGGGIYNGGGLIIEENTISENTAAQGGGIKNSSGSITIKKSILSNNSATHYGGAIGNLGSLSIINSTISGNRSGKFGGGIFQNSGGELLIVFPTSLTNLENPSEVTSSTNLIDQSIGLFAYSLFIPSSSLNIINSTITGNSAEQSGGGIASPSGWNKFTTTTITNSIVSGNTAATLPQIEGDFTSNTSIIQDSIEGLLDPTLRDNGGPTKTHALLAGSAAINAGDNDAANAAGLTNDQRGISSARIIDGTVDIGAFEVQGPFTQIDLRVVNSKTSTSIHGERSSLPENLTWVDEWGHYWVEIWISTPTTTELGILSANLNFTYNTDITTATHIEYGSAFTESQTGAINDLTGTIENLSAETNLTDVGDDQRVLFARIKFESTSDDAIDLDPQGQDLNPQSPDFLINFSEIKFVGDLHSEEIHGLSPITQILANPFDFNDDDIINSKDLVIFASNYNSVPSTSNSNYAWLADFDKNDQVNFRDLVLFVNNYNKTKLDQSTVDDPEQLPEAWDQFLTVNAQTEPKSKAKSITQATAESVFENVVEQVSPQLTPDENEKLENIEIQVVDLEGDLLGQAIPGTIYIDVNAAGYGWFVDTTPNDHSEFQYETPLSLIALPNSEAAGKIDLWSVIIHEIGHILGHDHEDEGLMEETLAPGVRKLSFIDENDHNQLSENETDQFFTSLKDDSNLIAF